MSLTDIKATIEQHLQGAGRPPPSETAVKISRVRWLVRLRWIYVLALVLGAAICGIVVNNLLLSVALGALAVLLAVNNIAVVLLISRFPSGLASDAARRLVRLTYYQLVADVALLCFVLAVTGGAVNPIAAVVVFHLAISASLLPRRKAYMLATVASALFIFLALMAAYSLRNGRVEPRFFLFPPVESLGAGLMLAGLFSAAVIACFYATVYFTDAILARLRRINQRLVESNRQLAALDLAKSRFLRLSSHQLRSPVAAIHSMMSAMQEVGGFNPQQYQIIQKIQARIQDVMAQVDEMMLLSTIKESAAETTQLAPVDVDATLAAVGEAFREEAVNKGLALAVDGSSRAIVSAWEDALETVLEHLISNAVKYTPSGGAVTATAARKGGQVEILVADSGIGIPADQQDRLFHEFFRATNARQVAGGTGMGLAIVKAIVERLGGMIEICSTQDRGTTVRVGLPVTAEAPSAAEAPAAEKSIHRELQTVFL